MSPQTLPRPPTPPAAPNKDHKTRSSHVTKTMKSTEGAPVLEEPGPSTQGARSSCKEHVL